MLFYYARHRVYHVFLVIVRSNKIKSILRRLFIMLMNGLASESVRRFVKWIFSFFGGE